MAFFSQITDPAGHKVACSTCPPDKEKLTHFKFDKSIEKLFDYWHIYTKHFFAFHKWTTAECSLLAFYQAISRSDSWLDFIWYRLRISSPSPTPFPQTQNLLFHSCSALTDTPDPSIPAWCMILWIPAVNLSCFCGLWWASWHVQSRLLRQSRVLS